ncbi:hypothetical protein MMSR116_18050 [Methylobacterium mesophilicum SR1.6/6]|uniref:Uncharacterized protein n=1 Tax=Methylobacterium mesophilicum SR1.6/6 TaxID=908290 RepID=A0A6B9FRA4_9HYPH|nr:hypothetical protein [Methylobacterium mesophilicum]QGY03578.1 hypothetical protein MMSR116_18050 [Methylobacterium mesophilicum SR1.6/6]
MMAPAPITHTTALAFDAAGEAAAIAESYVRAAGEFAQARDARGLSYSLRQAAVALAAAASTAQTLRPADGGGR